IKACSKTKLVPFCKLASKPPAIFTSPKKYASSRATSGAFSSIQTTPRSFWTTFSSSLCGLNSGIGLEIGNQDVLATKALAARIHELARSQKDLNSRLISVLVLSLLLGFFLFGFLFGLPLLMRSEEHTSELQSPYDLVCRLLLE